MKQLATVAITSLFGLTISVVQVQAQISAYRLIERDTAVNNKIQVQVTPGRATPISFSQTDEAISYILVADPSRLSYTTDADLKTGQATTIFLRVIQPLKFPGSTSTAITNLLVQTVDANGQKRLYNFDIVSQRSKSEYVGIQIAKAIPGQQKLLINKNRIATVDDIEHGLTIAINRGYTQHNDPVVTKVRQVIALLRTNEITIPEAAKSVDVPLTVILELGKIVINQR
jgi:spore germination protein YaaH